MVYIYPLERVCRIVNADIWRPRGNNHSGTEALEPSITNLSNRVYNAVLDASYIG